MGALMTELAGLAGVGALLNLPPSLTMILVVGALLLMAYTHSYLTVERIAIALGAFELVFLVVAVLARPDPQVMLAQAVDIPWGDRKYLYLVAANIGAVIMPWMVFFQQSAIVEKKITIADLPAARADTMLGAVLTQVIMASVLVAAAATLGASGHDGELDTVQRIAEAITPYLGNFGGKLLFGLGMAGAALVAAIVVTITAARTLSELLGLKCSLDHDPREAPWSLRRLFRRLDRLRPGRRFRSQSGFFKRRRAGDERLAAAAGARLSVPARPPPAAALSAARPLRRDLQRNHRCRRRLWRLFRNCRAF